MLSMGRSMSKRSPEIQEIRKKKTFTRFTRFTRRRGEVFFLSQSDETFFFFFSAVQVSTGEKLDTIIHI